MGEIRQAQPVKLIVGTLTAAPELLPEVEKQLTSLFGAVDARSEVFPFDETHYYDATMGHPIYRCFLAFATLIDASAIAAVKLATNDLEASIAAAMADRSGVSRPVNLDPGYLEQAKIVLVSTKNFFHRVYVARGIYAEVTLHYQGRHWQSFPWTFPDYAATKYHPFFTALRAAYRAQLQAAGYPVRIPQTPHRASNRGREPAL